MELLKAKLGWRRAWSAEGHNGDGIFVFTVVQHGARDMLAAGLQAREDLGAGLCWQSVRLCNQNLLQIDQANSPIADLACVSTAVLRPFNVQGYEQVP